MSKTPVIIYTDGSCLKNPGPGGYGIVMMHGKHRKELSGGFRRTTNNRMEMLAVIMALEALKRPCAVELYSDSRYTIDGIMKGWAKGWRKRGWKKSDKSKAKNSDLWARMLDLCETHEVNMNWVRGHAGDVENERCDVLARTAAEDSPAEVDEIYERGDA